MTTYPLSHIIRIQRVNRVRAPWLRRMGDEVAQLEGVIDEIKQIASQRGLDSQSAYDFVLEDIEDRCLKALGGEQ